MYYLLSYVQWTMPLPQCWSLRLCYYKAVVFQVWGECGEFFPQGYSAITSGDILCCHNWSGKACDWLLVGRGQGCCETSSNTQDRPHPKLRAPPTHTLALFPSPTKSGPVPNVSSAESEKPWCKAKLRDWNDQEAHKGVSLSRCGD